MSDSTLATRPAHIVVDPTPDGRIVVITVDNESLSSTVLRLTPAQAAKFGQRLIDVAWRLERP
ncbi:MAG TPA: hypothetical protein VMU34_08030 [Mycobacterium sp.]|nr:hypothetical protein [Mycobacterium sp.]